MDFAFNIKSIAWSTSLASGKLSNSDIGFLNLHKCRKRIYTYLPSIHVDNWTKLNNWTILGFTFICPWVDIKINVYLNCLILLAFAYYIQHVKISDLLSYFSPM
jgi:hypothetical protein